MAVAEIPAGPVEAAVRKERSLFQQSLHRLLQNKMAVASMIFIAILFVLAFIIAPFTNVFQDPIEQDLTSNNAVPEWMLLFVPAPGTFRRVDVWGRPQSKAIPGWWPSSHLEARNPAGQRSCV